MDYRGMGRKKRLLLKTNPLFVQTLTSAPFSNPIMVHQFPRYPSATKAVIVVIDDGGLTGGEGELGLKAEKNK